ncbi:MAG TPA: phospholipid carrier-dependent glycosyltransferase [Jiangellaceae bacterium]|nr:phospholipid carrier-dependent glycosyltransferase [Jiangellaceae bacterium]
MTRTSDAPVDVADESKQQPPDPDVAAVRARLVRPMPPDRWWGWLGPLFAGAVAAVLRLVDLGRPDKFVFDETYYAKDALSLLRFGDARAFIDGADDRVLEGDLDVFTDQPSFVVHPTIGKWLIAAGIRLLGMEPVGWRLATAVAGVVTVVLVARIGRRLFRSTLLGTTAGLLLAVDGMAITMSRTAILDGILAMFVIAAFGCVLADRDWIRRRYGNSLVAAEPGEPSPAAGSRPLLPVRVVAWRPWRLAAGVLLGLACGTKWSGVFALVVFGILTVCWEYGARRAAGGRSPLSTTVLRDAPVAFVTMVGSAFAVYLASWAGWIAGHDGWSRQWAASRPASGVAGMVPDWARSLWHYHAEMLGFHSGLDAPHDYASEAWGWLVLARPVSFDYASVEQGQAGCDVDRCSQAVLALGNPVLWWGGCVALLACLWMWGARRDWRAGAILAGIAATWLPWFLYLDRTTFSFYAIVIAPFVVLAVAYALGLILGPPGAPPGRRTVGAAVAGAYVLSVVVVAAWFYPIHVDAVIAYEDWLKRMWFRTPGAWYWI